MSDLNEFMNNLWKSEGQFISGTVDGKYFSGTVTNTRYMYGNDIEVTIDDAIVCDHQYVLHGLKLFNGDVNISDSEGFW